MAGCSYRRGNYVRCICGLPFPLSETVLLLKIYLKNICPAAEKKNRLTIEEASRYFGIGEKKLLRLINSNLDAGFVIQNGVKILIKHQRFEQFFDKLSSI